MIKPFYNTLVSKIAETFPKVVKGSLRHFPKEIDENTVLVVPTKISCSRAGMLPAEVRENYEIHILASIRSTNPFNTLVNRAVLLTSRLVSWIPENWADGVSFKNLEIESVSFDTMPEADELGFVVATITILVTYYSTD